MLQLWDQPTDPYWLKRDRGEKEAAEGTPEGDILWQVTHPEEER